MAVFWENRNPFLDLFFTRDGGRAGVFSAHDPTLQISKQNTSILSVKNARAFGDRFNTPPTNH